MIRGSCLCGGIQFEVTQVQGPFELCHCARCRKATGSAFSAGIWVARDAFTLLEGRDLIQGYEMSGES
jgi:hypothetical protein